MKALEDHGSERKAAKSLGLSRTQFVYKLRLSQGICSRGGCPNNPVPNRTRCRPCLDQAKGKKTKEETKKYNKEYKANNKEKLKKYNKIYQKNNLKKFQEHNRKYSKSEKGKLNARLRRQRRRARQAQVSEVQLTKHEIKLLQKAMPNCFKCGSEDRLQFDHHIPLIKGGTLTLNNTVILCISCNSGKCDKSPEEFYSPEELEKVKEHFRTLTSSKFL